MKAYRNRKLSQRCQLAKTEDGITPLKDEKGNFLLDHAGHWFLKISGGEQHDNRRLLPLDHEAFFKLKAREVEEALKGEGVTDATVTPADLYAEYVAAFRKPNLTFAPEGHPEEFSIVVPATICVNWQGSLSLGTPGAARVPMMSPQATSLFARLRAAANAKSNNGQSEAPPTSVNRKPKSGAA